MCGWLGGRVAGQPRGDVGEVESPIADACTCALAARLDTAHSRS